MYVPKVVIFDLLRITKQFYFCEPLVIGIVLNVNKESERKKFSMDTKYRTVV